ncbi:c091388c-cd1b-4740-b846-a1061d17705f [Sclerotinia trifoliorum]|uniref:C091388c-cd1b-4740-b846-a1061d17705f n=1 Tax=Sclerotinia trifoliorum TaxID=28548 RepID=A0A8H2VSB0_9HELO|nr:c091388c-cd1b-4740-b846-a1061d17705f [Sclerotinia trifoliorum]
MSTLAETPPSDSSFRRVQVHTDSASIDSKSCHVNKTQNTPTHAPLTILSSSAMNMPHLNTDPSLLKSSTGTIRSVPSDDSRLNANSQDDSPTAQFPSQNDSNIPITPRKSSYNSINGPKSPLGRQNPPALGMTNGVVRSISTEFGSTKYSSSNVHVVGESLANDGEDFNSAIGKASLGKSGRVIERLTKENDMLKRDVKIERLRAEEALDQARLAESRFAQENEEWERKLRDAALNSTVLKRRERQLADAKEKIEAERLKAEKATESELFWKSEMEKIEKECKAKVEEAQSRAELYEGRNNVMTNHWKDQEKQANQTVTKLEKEIKIIVKERRADDEKITMLKRLAEQQADQLKALQKEKDDVDRKYEEYKTEKEQSLADIKENATKQEKANEEIMVETQKVLGELKWALNVKKYVKGAE